jgi:glyoxylase-like metal-dependent hydrolase (beta-lactamase superfamily II)
MSAIRQQGRINENTVLIDIGMYGVAGATAVYLIQGDKKCLIDGGTRTEAHRLIRTLRKLGAFPPDMIIVTHSHYDHAQGIPILQRQAAKAGKQIEILASEQAIPLLEDQSWNEVVSEGPFEGVKNVTPLKEGDTIDLGKITLKIYDVPGHCKDHIAILDEKNKNIFIGDAIGNKIADHTFLPPFMPPFWDPDAFLSTINKLKQIDYDSCCLAHFGYIYGDEAKLILDEGLEVCDTWWQLFDKNAEKLDDIEYMIETIMQEISPDVPDIKILSLKLKVLFTLMTTWQKLARKKHQPVGVLLLHGILKQLAAGYKTYKKPE